MANILFGWPLASDAATLSGGAWTLPLTNLQLPALASVARSTTDANADTIINIDQGSALAVSVVALVRHNMRSAALWRVRLSTVSNFATNVYDTGWIAVWPVQWPVGVLPAGHPNAATRLLTDAQITALDPPRDAVHVLSAETSARYIRIEMDDTTNSDTYVQIGRLVVAPRFQPTCNMAVGSEFGFDDGTTVGRALSRARIYDVKPKGRSLSLSFENLPDTEALTVLRDMMEQLGQSGHVYVVQDPADTELLQRRSFLATLRALSAVRYAAARYAAVPVVLDEVI